MLIALNEKAHTATSRSRFTLFHLTVECWADSTQMILQPVASLKLFSHKTLRSTILQRKWCQQQRTEFFNLHLTVHGSHRFVVNHRQTLFLYIQLKTQNSRLFAAFLVEYVNQQKAGLLWSTQLRKANNNSSTHSDQADYGGRRPINRHYQLSWQKQTT